MTPDDIDWPLPVCVACRDRRCHDCDRASGCEDIDCPWLWEETQ